MKPYSSQFIMKFQQMLEQTLLNNRCLEQLRVKNLGEFQLSDVFLVENYVRVNQESERNKRCRIIEPKIAAASTVEANAQLSRVGIHR